MDGFDEFSLCLGMDHRCCMPSSASVDHVENHSVAVEENVTFDLFIEFVCNLDVGCIPWSWSLPFSTDMARLTHARDEREDSITDTHTFEEASHGVLGRVKPPDVEFTEGQLDTRWINGPKEADNSTDIELSPVVWVNRVVSLVTKCTDMAWGDIWSPSAT